MRPKSLKKPKKQLDLTGVKMPKYTTLIMRSSYKAQFLKCEISKKPLETNYYYYYLLLTIMNVFHYYKK
jgi:hypothetical protein